MNAPGIRVPTSPSTSTPARSRATTASPRDQSPTTRPVEDGSRVMSRARYPWSAWGDWPCPSLHVALVWDETSSPTPCRFLRSAPGCSALVHSSSKPLTKRLSASIRTWASGSRRSATTSSRSGSPAERCRLKRIPPAEDHKAPAPCHAVPVRPSDPWHRPELPGGASGSSRWPIRVDALNYTRSGRRTPDPPHHMARANGNVDMITGRRAVSWTGPSSAADTP